MSGHMMGSLVRRMLMASWLIKQKLWKQGIGTELILLDHRGRGVELASRIGGLGLILVKSSSGRVRMARMIGGRCQVCLPMFCNDMYVLLITGLVVQSDSLPR